MNPKMYAPIVFKFLFWRSDQTWSNSSSEDLLKLLLLVVVVVSQ